MRTLGRHLIAEYYDCDAESLDDIDAMRATMLEAADRVGATVCGEVFHRFAPNGVSGAVVIAESHLSLHTWPNRRYVAVDIFTCGGLDPTPGFRFIGRALRAASARVQEIVRGLAEDLDGEPGLTADQVLQIDDVELMVRRPLVVDLSD